MREIIRVPVDDWGKIKLGDRIGYRFSMYTVRRVSEIGVYLDTGLLVARGVTGWWKEETVDDEEDVSTII